MSRKAELAHHEHVQRRAQPPRDLPGDGYAAPGEAEHHNVGLAREGCQMLAQDAAGLSAIAVPHEKPTYASSGEDADMPERAPGGRPAS